MIIDAYTADGTWLDCMNIEQNNVRRVLSEWNRRWGPVLLRERERYVPQREQDFADWLKEI